MTLTLEHPTRMSEFDEMTFTPRIEGGLIVRSGLTRIGLRAALEGIVDVRFVGGTELSFDSLAAQHSQLGIIILDAGLCGVGSETVGRIRAHWPKAAILALTYDSHRQSIALARKGVRNFLSEAEDDPDQIRAAIFGATHSDEVSPKLARRFSSVNPRASIESLTRRELEVLSLVARGEGDEDIAGAVFLSVHGVKKHVRSILMKLDVRNRTEAAVLATLTGICSKS